MMPLAAVISDSRAMAGRCLRRSLRDPEAFFTALTLPIVLLLLFVYVFGGALASGGGHYVDYVVPGLIVLCAGFGAGTTAVAVATDMSNGIVDRIRSMPVFGSSLLVGHVVASLARNLVATTLVIGVGLLIGWRPTASALDWLAAAGMILLFITAISWLAAAVGLLARTAEAADAFTMVLMFVPYVSTAFVPAGTMPTALADFARYQPFTPIIETMRGLWMGSTSTGAPLAGEALLAVALLRRDPRRLRLRRRPPLPRPQRRLAAHACYPSGNERRRVSPRPGRSGRRTRGSRRRPRASRRRSSASGRGRRARCARSGRRCAAASCRRRGSSRAAPRGRCRR